MLKLICSVYFLPERIVPLKATCSQCENEEGYVAITPTKEQVSVITLKGRKTEKKCSLDILRLSYSYFLRSKSKGEESGVNLELKNFVTFP